MDNFQRLVSAVKWMREQQRAFFRGRAADHLRASKEAERRVDDLLGELTAGPGLFEREGPFPDP